MMPVTPIPDNVRQVLELCPEALRPGVNGLRNLIFTTAAKEQVGALTETLKWGEPAYLTQASKAGTTVRIGWKANNSRQFKLLVNCRTTLLDSYRTHYGDVLHFEGNRAILLTPDDDLASPALAHCIAMALTYHRNKT